MKKSILAILFLAAALSFPVPSQAGEYETPEASRQGPASEKPSVSFSDWRTEKVTDTMNAYIRDITVSDGGNYLMTYLDVSGTGRYYFYYDAIYQGKGVQKVFSHDWESEEIRIGKLFRFETMDECDMDIDQLISDHITIQASDGSDFILIFRPNGGKYDGTVQTVTVRNGRRELVSDSYQGTTSIELLGVFRFPEEDRSALHFGQNVIQPDSTGFQIQMGLYADVNDGIALMVYTNASGNEVCVAQPIIDGFGVLSAYDSAKTVEEIKVGHFGIVGFSCHYIDASFGETDQEDKTGEETPGSTEPVLTSNGLDAFLNGNKEINSDGSQRNDPDESNEHRITLVDRESVVTDCPETAKAGDTVVIHTMDVADGEVVVEVNGSFIGNWVDNYTYSFTMPDEDAEVHAWISTSGYAGA